MKTIIVTGGMGFIGSHTCLALLKSNYKVIIIDSLINSSLKTLENLKIIIKNEFPNIEDRLRFFKADITNIVQLDKVFKKILDIDKTISAVIHFAGLKSVSESISDPLKYWDTNISGSINLFKIMDKYNCNVIIFSSSATIYSYKSISPLKESYDLDPINPYGKTKLTVENLLRDLYESSTNKWKICNLRYFNPIGAHESGLIGENPKGTPANIFPLILKVASQELSNLKIFGNNYDTKDGTCVRDYIHVMDVAEGHLSALNYVLRNKPQIDNFNLGTGKGTSVLSLVETFQLVNNVKIPYEFTKRRIGDMAHVVADNEKSKIILNWQPKRNIEKMCSDGWKSKINN